MNDTSIILNDQDLGVWFSINGTSIKSQPQLDLAVISLAELYGFKEISMPTLMMAHKVVSNLSEDDINPNVVMHLINYCEKAIQYLNSLAEEVGYKFDFSGEEYENLTLYKLGDLQN